MNTKHLTELVEEHLIYAGLRDWHAQVAVAYDGITGRQELVVRLERRLPLPTFDITEDNANEALAIIERDIADSALVANKLNQLNTPGHPHKNYDEDGSST